MTQLQAPDLAKSLQGIADSLEFKALAGRFRQFSPFQALGIERREVRHTTLLAWMLDPRESHGAGPAALHALVAKLFPGPDAPSNLADAVVLPEHVLQKGSKAGGSAGARLDILILGKGTTRNASQSWAIAIEAKIDALEGGIKHGGISQLPHYATLLADLKKFPAQVDKFFLTVDPCAPRHGWTNITWGRNVVDCVRAVQSALVSPQPFLTTYEQLLMSLATTQQARRVAAFNCWKALSPADKATVDEMKGALADGGWKLGNVGDPWFSIYWRDVEAWDLLLGCAQSLRAAAFADWLDQTCPVELRDLLIPARSDIAVDAEASEIATAPEVAETLGRGTGASIRVRPARFYDWMFYSLASRTAQGDVEFRLVVTRHPQNPAEHTLIGRLTECARSCANRFAAPMLSISRGEAWKLPIAQSKPAGPKASSITVMCSEGKDVPDGPSSDHFWQAVAALVKCHQVAIADSPTLPAAQGPASAGASATTTAPDGADVAEETLHAPA